MNKIYFPVMSLLYILFTIFIEKYDLFYFTATFYTALTGLIALILWIYISKRKLYYIFIPFIYIIQNSGYEFFYSSFKTILILSGTGLFIYLTDRFIIKKKDMNRISFISTILRKLVFYTIIIVLSKYFMTQAGSLIYKYNSFSIIDINLMDRFLSVLVFTAVAGHKLNNKTDMFFKAVCYGITGYYLAILFFALQNRFIPVSGKYMQNQLYIYMITGFGLVSVLSFIFSIYKAKIRQNS